MTPATNCRQLACKSGRPVHRHIFGSICPHQIVNLDLMISSDDQVSIMNLDEGQAALFSSTADRHCNCHIYNKPVNRVLLVHPTKKKRSGGDF